MKYFLMLLLIISCSQNNNQNSSNNLQNNEDIVNFEPLNLSTIEDLSGVTIPSASLDFSSIISNLTVVQDLIISNKQSSDFTINASDIIANDIAPFVMSENGCADKTLERNRSCKIRFSIKNNPNPSELILTKSLTIKGVVISLNATLLADTTNPSLPVNGILVSPTLLDFGLMKSGEMKELGIIVSNRTSSNQTITSPIISNPKISISSNTCSILPRNRSCTIKVKYTASSDESVSLENFTSINNIEIKHSVVVQSPTISSPAILNITPVTAAANFSLTEPQIQTSSITFKNNDLNSLNFPVSLSVSPNDGAISVSSISCSGGFSRNRTCTVNYSVNSSIAAEGISQYIVKLSSGTSSSASYTINLNTIKTSPLCDLLNSQGNGITSILNVSTVAGSIPNCAVVTCNSNFKPAVDSKSCVAKLCNELNSGELSALGFITTGAIISGTYPSCSLSCNSSLQELAGDGKSCVDKTPTGSISFVQDYTSVTSGNLLNITQNNAQQIQFYSDASCSVAVGSPISMPLTQTSITVSIGDGTKTTYAKLLNGTASSPCLSSSIVLDQTPPIFVGGFIYPTQTESITTAISVESIVISDANPMSLEFSLGSGILFDNLLGFTNISPVVSTFEASVANGYLPSGFTFSTSTDYRLGFRITDAAGNQSAVQVAGPFQYIVPMSGTPFANFGNGISGDQYNTDGVRSYHNQLNSTNLYGATSTNANFSVEAINSMAVQSDGKIILAGKTDRTLSSTNTDIAVWRTNQDGSLDTTFSDDGFFTRIGTESQIGGTDSGAEEVLDVKIRSNGKILLVGTGARSTAGSIYTSCVIWQLNSDGTLDSSFGGTSYVFQAPTTATTTPTTPGIVVISGAGGYPTTTATGPAAGTAGAVGSDICRSVEILSDGSFVVGGSTKGYHNLDFMLAKFSSAGLLDTSFVGGTVFNTASTRVASTRTGFFLMAGTSISNTTSANDQIFEMTIKDSNIYAVGQHFTAAGTPHNDIGVLKVSANTGLADSSFATAGAAGAGLYIHTVASSSDIGQDLVVLDNNKIVAVGAIGASDNQLLSRNMAAIRLNSNGTLDSSFATAGVFTHSGASTNGVTNREDVATTIKILPSGKFIIGGQSNKSDTTTTGGQFSGLNNFDLVVWKLNSNGTLDSTFNSVGYISKGISEFYANANSADWTNAGFGADFLSDLVIIDNKIFVTGSVYFGRSFVNTDGILWRID